VVVEEVPEALSSLGEACQPEDEKAAVGGENRWGEIGQAGEATAAVDSMACRKLEDHGQEQAFAFADHMARLGGREWEVRVLVVEEELRCAFDPSGFPEQKAMSPGFAPVGGLEGDALRDAF
jgi:hypothetical protein